MTHEEYRQACMYNLPAYAFGISAGKEQEMPSDKLPALPPRPQTILGLFKTFEVVAHMDAQDARIASLLRYSELCQEHLSNALRQHMPAAEGQCASCLLTKATSMRFNAEVKVAELEREIREAHALLRQAIPSNGISGADWRHRVEKLRNTERENRQ
jgi:hypothetical protein